MLLEGASLGFVWKSFGVEYGGDLGHGINQSFGLGCSMDWDERKYQYFSRSTEPHVAESLFRQQSCALYQGLVPTNYNSAVINALATSVQENNNNIDTGILGSKYLLRALCDNGRSDTAFALAAQTS
jgi:hypothetical protein